MKRKLKLSELKVNSFVTELKNEEIHVGGVATQLCVRDTIIPTRCGCTGYYPSLNAPCDELTVRNCNIQTYPLEECVN